MFLAKEGKEPNMDLDKRKTPRIDFHLEVVVKGCEGTTEIRDLSLGGLFVRLEDAAQLREGDIVHLVMQLPLEKTPLYVRARVVRVTSEGIGVEYMNLLPHQEMILEQCFHIFKHTMPMAANE
jgi:hypothetical protein